MHRGVIGVHNLRWRINITTFTLDPTFSQDIISFLIFLILNVYTFDSDGVWEINVCNLDDDVVADLEAEGVDVKNKEDEKGNYVLAKRRVKRKGGDVNSPPKVVDSNNTPMHNTLIGNGSLVNVKFSPYEWTFGNKQGIGLDLQAVQVVDLVEYTTGAEDFDPVSGGYQSSDEDIPFPTN